MSDERISRRLVDRLHEAVSAGDEVTIWPPLGQGESRDTEPGAQPWKAKCIGYIWLEDNLMVAVDEEGSRKPYRLVDFEHVTMPSLIPYRSPR